MGTRREAKTNFIGLAKTDYNGSATTLCQGCGHNSIANQVVQVAFELSVQPHEIIKLSGIGCSSKSPAYFWGGRMALIVCTAVCPVWLRVR